MELRSLMTSYLDGRNLKMPLSWGLFIRFVANNFFIAFEVLCLIG